MPRPQERGHGPVDGMILAAGLGTRLRPLTDRVPKALVPVGGVPVLERIARRLVAAGVDRLIINVHHHADRIVDFVEGRDGFGVDVRISREPEPLETGGGLLHARSHFRGDGPFLLHNVDVITTLDLAAMVRAHAGSGALATLAVHDRPAGRYLRFDADGLQARVDRRDGSVDTARPPRGPTRDRAFAGVHVLSPSIFGLVTERGAFSIIRPYLRLAGSGHAIAPYEMGEALWLEIGTPERLARARRVLDKSDAARGDV
ncbi:MAG: nucleotidyltransferase family protein [Gemmatimonadota bacterium]